MSCRAMVTCPASSGNEHRSATTFRVNSTLPAPMMATRIMSESVPCMAQVSKCEQRSSRCSPRGWRRHRSAPSRPTETPGRRTRAASVGWRGALGGPWSGRGPAWGGGGARLGGRGSRPPAGHHELEVGAYRHLGRDVQGVGDEGEALVVDEGPRDLGGGGAAGEPDRVTCRDAGRRLAGDPELLFLVAAALVAERELVEDPLRDRAAAGAGQQALAPQPGDG